jgi:glucokinase
MEKRGGIDLGGTKIQAVIVDEKHEVIGDARHPTPRDGGPEAVAAEIVATLREATQKAAVHPAELVGVGVGSPGAIDKEAGTVAHARNLPDWEEPFALADVLSRELGVPVALGNDVQVAVAAEFELGAGRPYSSLLGVFWGTGVGGGLILEGKQWLGRGAAGEFGHMVVRLGGARSSWGVRGSVEAYAGRAAMEARARRAHAKGQKTELFKLMEKAGRDRLTSGVWAKALSRHDPLATRLVEKAVSALGAGIASAINLLDLEAVVIGGGLGTRLGAPYARRIEQAMMPHLFLPERPPTVRVAELGDLGGAIGAALLVPGHGPGVVPGHGPGTRRTQASGDTSTHHEVTRPDAPSPRG